MPDDAICTCGHSVWGHQWQDEVPYPCRLCPCRSYEHDVFVTNEET